MPQISLEPVAFAVVDKFALIAEDLRKVLKCGKVPWRNLAGHTLRTQILGALVPTPMKCVATGAYSADERKSVGITS
jgi:hypothetical protein